VLLILPNKTVNPLLKVVIIKQLVFVIFVGSLSVFNHVGKETSGCPLGVLFGKAGVRSFEFFYVDDSSVAIGVGLLVGQLELVFVQVVHLLGCFISKFIRNDNLFYWAKSKAKFIKHNQNTDDSSNDIRTD
jgi:hypothetical protein